MDPRSGSPAPMSVPEIGIAPSETAGLITLPAAQPASSAAQIRKTWLAAMISTCRALEVQAMAVAAGPDGNQAIGSALGKLIKFRCNILNRQTHFKVKEKN